MICSLCGGKIAGLDGDLPDRISNLTERARHTCWGMHPIRGDNSKLRGFFCDECGVVLDKAYVELSAFFAQMGCEVGSDLIWDGVKNSNKGGGEVYKGGKE